MISIFTTLGIASAPNCMGPGGPNNYGLVLGLGAQLDRDYIRAWGP